TERSVCEVSLWSYEDTSGSTRIVYDTRRNCKLVEFGFDGTTKLKPIRMCEDFNKWAVDYYDVSTKTFMFIKGDPLHGFTTTVKNNFSASTPMGITIITTTVDGGNFVVP
ncbi:hypothetical protein LINPERHAP1_LOCUS8494, partial [Linum perenne]